MMIGYKDRHLGGGHDVVLDGMLFTFGPVDGTLWSPTSRQESVLTLTAVRRERFVRVELPDAPAFAVQQSEMPVGADTEQVAETPPLPSVSESEEHHE